MAESFKHKPGNGSLFKNNYKEKEQQPDFQGSIVLQDGTEQQIAGWKKEGANGPFISLSISDPYEKKDQNKPSVTVDDLNFD
jgi:hypothetical protein